MDRLTYKSIMGDYGIAKDFANEFVERNAVRNRLGKYEDLGMEPGDIGEYIPKFPIGSSVYRIYHNRVFELRVIGFKIEHDGKYYKLYINYNAPAYSLWINDWIKETDRIYKTKDEAERILRGRENFENKE